MPLFPGFPYPRRYNTLRLLGYGYNSVFKLCAVTIVIDLRSPLFAELKLAKSVLASLLSDQTLALMRVRVFTLMPDHLHLLAGVRQPEFNLLADLQENLDYLVMNSVKAGYVTRPQFYPYTGFLC